MWLLRIHKILFGFLLCLGVGCAHLNQKSFSAGKGTVHQEGQNAFTLPLSTVPVERLREFTFGNRIFNTNWVQAPSSTSRFDGLGPLFNRVSCSACHTFDGRGQPPEEGKMMMSMLVRISLPGEPGLGGVHPHPVYGDQINDRALRGIKPEGWVSVTYQDREGYYPDGTKYVLKEPHYKVNDLNYGPLGDDVLMSPRVAPAVIGLGLLEAVSDKTLLDLMAKQNKRNDGISGRINWVWDPERQEKVIGRFGWKANKPSLAVQNAGAFNGDIGITSPLFKEENISATILQGQSEKIYVSPENDIGKDFLDAVLFYTRNLSVPARRQIDDPKVQKGEALFAEIQCAVCHVPTLETRQDAALPWLSNQQIHPYTDMLLHDMGEALSDGRPDYEATGYEWRTAPLWGLGLIDRVNGHTRLMHDGRARNIEEAILWHDGEARESKKKFLALSKTDRDSLLAFLQSL